MASETCALDLIDADFEEIQPGELIDIHKDGFIRSHQINESTRKAFCSFEPIYFARPDSKVFGTDIYSLRKNMGKVLAREISC